MLGKCVGALCSARTSTGGLTVCSRERERELYGPKKRGPKPKTFLLKVHSALEFHF